MRLTKGEKSNISSLINDKLSLNEIVRLTGIKKTTVYYYLRKERGMTSLDSLVIPKDEEIVGEFLGLFAGDGSFFFDPIYHHYTFAIHLGKSSDEEYGSYIIEMMRKHFRKCVRRYYHGSRLRIYFYSKRLHSYVSEQLEIKDKTYSVRLKRDIDSYSDDFLSGFVRGLIDTDGHISSNRIMLKMASRQIMLQVRDILDSKGICNQFKTVRDPRPNCKTLYSISIRKGEMKIFNEKIGSSNPRKKRALLSALGGI